MKIKVSEFAESRGIKPDTINAYMRRHNLVDSSQKDKWQYELDTESEEYQILDKKYPLPKPIEIVEDKESRQKLIEVQRELANALSENIQLQEKFAKAMTKVAELSTVQKMLEDKSNELLMIQYELKEATKEIHEKELLLSHEKHEREMLSAEFKRLKTDSDEEIAVLKTQLEIEKNKSWIQKLFHK